MLALIVIIEVLMPPTPKLTEITKRITLYWPLGRSYSKSPSRRCPASVTRPERPPRRRILGDGLRADFSTEVIG